MKSNKNDWWYENVHEKFQNLHGIFPFKSTSIRVKKDEDREFEDIAYTLITEKNECYNEIELVDASVLSRKIKENPGIFFALPSEVFVAYKLKKEVAGCMPDDLQNFIDSFNTGVVNYCANPDNEASADRCKKFSETAKEYIKYQVDKIGSIEKKVKITNIEI